MIETRFGWGAMAARAAAVVALVSGVAQGNEGRHGGEPRGAWLSGDFHQHSFYTDGATPFDFEMAKNAEFGLHWWANSEHGGARPTDGNGVRWTDTSVYPVNPILGNPLTSNMYRWQSLRDFVFPDILRARATYPDRRIFSGLEWNVPGHEHCSTAIVAKDASAISAFEFQFDASDADMSRIGEVTPYGVLAKQNGRTYPGNANKTPPLRHADAVKGCEWMQAQYRAGTIENGWIVFGHVERAGQWNASSAGGYNVEHFRDFNNAGPDVCFGFEGAPGHQVNPLRGLGNVQFGGTYGGVGYYTAKVGGLWDALLGEGRHFFSFASSDYHGHWTNCSNPTDPNTCGDDFFPGEYQRDWVFAKDADRDGRYSLDEIADGLRSGKSYFVQGDLVNGLEFTASRHHRAAGMGETLVLDRRGDDEVRIEIRFRSPERNANGDEPKVDHIDLIAGEIGGLVQKELAPGVPNPEYSNPTNPTTQVIASFDARDFRHEKDGWRKVSFEVKGLEKSTYFRLRGTNLACDTPNETGPAAAALPARDHCSPLADVLMGPNDAQKAFADLWFYSNPIYVMVE